MPEEQVHHAGDDKDHQDVEYKSVTRHMRYADQPTAIDNGIRRRGDRK